jgi:L-iditol 2-dehydrogenase
MQALLLDAPRSLRVEEVPEPDVGPGDVLLNIKACGICGSDVHGYDGSSGRRMPPIIMGHEAAGVVVKVGAEVRLFRPWDRVTFDSTISCGQCEFCMKGDVNLCEMHQVVGVSCDDYRRDGAFAEYISVPERILYELPDTFAFEKAALIEAVSIAVHALRVSQVVPGSAALVVGAGMIGLLTIQALLHFGCGPVLAVDVDEGKLRLAHQLGPTMFSTEPTPRSSQS